MNTFLAKTIYHLFDKLRILETTRMRKARLTSYSSVQFMCCAVLLPSASLIIMVTMGFHAVYSASILGDSALSATLTLTQGQTSSLLNSLRSDNGGAANTVTSGDLSISLHGANPFIAECSDAFQDPGAMAINSAGKVVPVRVSGKVDTGTLETYTLTYVAADEKDSVSVDRTVTVADTTPPEISLEGGKTMTIGTLSVVDYSSLFGTWFVTGGCMAGLGFPILGK